MSDDKNKETVREVVRDRYAKVATAGSSCCSDSSPCCCPPAGAVDDISARLGYSEEELALAPLTGASP